MGKFLILIGCACILFSGYLFKQRYNPVRLSIKSYKKNVAVFHLKPTNKPASIEILSQNLHLPIIPADIDKKQWDTTTEGVSYLATSPVPGEIGNSIMYGHNWPNLLGKLPLVAPGEEIVIHYTDGTQKAFKVVTTGEVKHDQVSILDQTDESRLTIYTCSGFLDSKRFVVIATPIS